MKNFTKFLGRNRSGMMKVLLVVVGMVWGVGAWGQLQTYNSGSGSWTVPDGVTKIRVQCWGGGGGGGNSNNLTGNGGGGAGGGGYSSRIVDVTPGQTYYYSVGSGGAGGPANSTTAAGDGGVSWFNNTNAQPGSSGSSNCLAYGGSKGINAGNGGAGAGAGFGDVGYVFTGGTGGNSGISGGGGGGSSAGTASNGADGGVGNTAGTGLIGTAPTGGGNGGVGSTSDGGNGVAPGGGGGGGNDLAANKGGDGASGRVVISAIYTYYSSGTGSPNTLTNWKTNRNGTGNSPSNFTSGDIFVIQNTHTMTTTSTWSISGTDSKLQVEDGGVLKADHQITISSSTTFQLDSGSKYIHNNATTNTSTTTFGGIESFDANSTIEFQDFETTNGTSTVAFEVCYNASTTPFGNIIWNIQSGTEAYLLRVSTTSTLTLNGSLTITKTGASGSLTICSKSANGKLKVNGNFSQSNGTFNISNSTVGSSGSVLEVVGNFSLSGGVFDLNTAGSYTSNMYLGGNFSMTGGTFRRTSSSATLPKVYFNKSGTQTFTQSAGTFTTTGINFDINSGSTLQLASDFTLTTTLEVKSGGILDIPSGFKTSGSGTTNVNSGGKIIVADANGIVSAGTSSGAVQTTTRTFNAGGIYEYDGTVQQSTGSGLPTSISGQLIINNASGVTMTQGTLVTGTLNLTSGIVTSTTSNFIGLGNGGTVINYNSTNYVYGPFRRYLTSGQDHFFPVGDASNYRPFELNSASCTSGAYVQVSVASSGASTYNFPLISIAGRNWFVDYVSGTFNNALVKITESGLSASNLIGKSTAQAGAYSSEGGANIGSTITTSAAVTMGSDLYFAIGVICAPYSGTKTVGTSGCDFTSLNDAISKLNSCGYTGNIILELQSNYDGTSTTEGASNPMITFPSTFAGVASSSSRTITIQPASGVNSKSITSASATGTILINGSDYIYFNGSPRPGGVNTMSNANNLSIINTHASTGYAVRFTNDATYNKIEYCNVKANPTSSSNGVIIFSNPSSTTGNSYNEINYCEITKAATTPTNCIYSVGLASNINKNNIVNECYIYDYFNGSNQTNSGISIHNYNSAWSITNNRFYQTASRNLTSASANHRVINIYNDGTIGQEGNNFTVTGNTIGGNASDNSGTYNFEGEGSAASGNFSAIYLKVGTTTASTVSNNTIKNLALQNVQTTATAGFEGGFNGIAILGGKVDVGSFGNGNTIGSISAANSISYYSPHGEGAGPIYGIYINTTSDVTVAYNNIGGFSTNAASGTLISYRLAGIYNYSTGGTISITNNTIGSTSVANSMVCGIATSSTTETFYGIYSSSTGAATINSNTIQNILCYGTGVAYGIYNNASALAAINSNTIKNVFVYGTGSTNLYAIYNKESAASSTINSNTITDLTNGHDVGGTNSVYTCGIYNNSSNSSTISSNEINTLTIKNGLFRGIWENGSASANAVVISNNTIGTASVDNINISSTNQNAEGSTAPHSAIFLTGAGTNVTASSNTIQNITLSGTPGATGVELVGIYTYSGSKTITSNNISYLKNSHTGSTNKTFLSGILYAGNSTVSIQKNSIQNLINQSTNTSSTIRGIYISANATSSNIYNNLIKITNALNGSNLTTGLMITGVYLSAIPTTNLYHNTIVIGGQEGGSVSTACYRNEASCPTLNAKNNIFINNRTTTSTGKHYAIYDAAPCTTSSTLFDNNYIEVENSTYTAYSTNAKNISTWNVLAFVGTDTDGSANNVTVDDDGTLTATEIGYVSTGTSLSPTVTDDINGSFRESYTKGCYEGAFNYYTSYAIANTDANTLSNWNSRRDGSGSAPSNFTTAANFRVQSGHKYQVTSSWTGNSLSTIYVESGGALDVNAQTISTWSALNIAGTGVTTSGALLSTSSSLSTVSIPITLSADATVTSYGSGNLTLTGNITTAGYTLTVNGNNNTTISTGVISGSGIVSKSGSGILTLSGTNTHTGGTTVSAGTLAIGNNSGLGTGTLTINGGSLDASGADRTITNAVTISNDFGFTGTYNLTQNTGGIALTGAAVITVTANNLTLNGVIANSGTGNVTVTSTGNGTWTCPAGVTSATVYCWGGGGGGGGASSTASYGGGAGGAMVKLTVTTTPGTTYKYTVGAGGAGGAQSGSTPGSNGNPTYFGNSSTGIYSDALIIAQGGAGSNGQNQRVGSTTTTPNNFPTSGTGFAAYFGGNGTAAQGSVNGGHGGGGASSGSAGNNGTEPVGGCSTVPCGSPGTATTGYTYNGAAGGSGSGGGNGSVGSQPSGGGGGAKSGAGGNGGNGQLVIDFTPAQSITKLGAGTLTLGGTNTFSNGVTLNAGTLNINNAAALGATTGTFTINGGTINNTSGGAITMNNYPMSWAGHFTFTGSNELNMGAGAVAMTATRQVTVSASTLTVGGIISGSTFGLTKLGAGTMTLSGVNTYTGATTVTAGTLAMGVNNAIPVGGGGVVLNGGTLSTGNFTAGSTSTNIGTLTLSENSTLALGTGTLYFSSSTGVSWTAAKTLTITGFVSSATNTAGTAGRLFVDYRSGNDCSNCGLTGSSGTNQLGLISFNTATINGVAGTYGAMQMVSGEIVAFSVSPTITLASNTISAADNCASSIKVPIQSFSLAVTNGTGNLTNVGFTTTGTYVQADISKYQLWYHSSNDITGASQLGTDLSSSGGQGARTFTSFTSPTLSNSATYYFWITVDVASGATNNATIAVNAISTSNLTSTSTKVGSDTDAGGTQTLKSSPSISSHPSAATICYGGTYSPSVTASGGVTLSYQWQFSTDGSTGWSNVVDNTPTNATFTNNTTATLTQTGNIAQGSAYYYRCVVSSTGNGCSSVNSNAAQLTINADPTIGTQPSAIAECVGGTDAMSVTASGGTPSLTYQWYSNTTSSNTGGSSIGSATSSSYTVPSSSAGTTYYYVEVSASGSGCSTATSNAVAAVITAAPNAGTLSGTDAICSNGSTTFTSNGDSGGAFTSATTAAATVNVSTGAITPVAAGSSIITYTVTGTGGCSENTIC